ncbi:MAG: GNAT family N-acetyltransferase [Deltaproteobacteria bacterium]|nr:GNAT family N-acetyltransferase [Deltaproteobacteria bacterium]MCK5710670.1 GNAT family N-acetyltransferase [Deltaproteobacteria bacterium]
MENPTIREAEIKDAVPMAEILREIGWSEKRNKMPLNEVSKPIEELIEHCSKDAKGHTMIVAIDEKSKVIGFTNVHWVPFIMLGSWEGYVSDVFVSPQAGGQGAGSALIKHVMQEGEKRGCMRLMLTNGKEKPSYKTGFYKKMGWTERPKVANFVYYYKEPWS